MRYEPDFGLYAHLVTVELRRLLEALEPIRVDASAPCRRPPRCRRARATDIERAPRAVPEAERLTRKAEFCKAILVWLREERHVESALFGEDLKVSVMRALDSCR